MLKKEHFFYKKNNGSWFACYLYTYVTMKMSANFLSLHFHYFKTFEYDYLLKPLLFLCLCVCFYRQSHVVMQSHVGLGLLILLPLPPQSWDYRDDQLKTAEYSQNNILILFKSSQATSSTDSIQLIRTASLHSKCYPHDFEQLQNLNQQDQSE